MAHHLRSERTYERHLPGLAPWAGWFALACGDRLCGVFPTHAAASVAWMATCGPVPALIRRVTLAEPMPLGPPADADSPASDAPTCDVVRAEAFAPWSRVNGGWVLPDGGRPGALAA